jgi:hypothetical protein
VPARRRRPAARGRSPLDGWRAEGGRAGSGRVEGGGTKGARGAIEGAIGGASRVLIDGRNVQFALARGSAASGPSALPTTALIARLRAAFSPPTEVELILDGHPGGSPSGRVAPAFTVSYSRYATADQVIGDRVAEALRALGPAGAWSVLVVTNDREVRDHARRNGARVEGTAWLAARLAAPSGPPTRPGTSIGHGRQSRPPRTPRSG